MGEDRGIAPAWLIAREPYFVVGACAVAFMSIGLLLGHISLSWDALNHHIYLGWTAEHPRFANDYLAASYQSYQYPYLYWPIYKLAVGGASGVAAAMVLALMHLTAAPPVWKVARICIPGTEWFAVAMRVAAVVLAFMSGVVLSMFDTTANDLLSAIPLVWAVAMALEPVGDGGSKKQALGTAVCLSGLLVGVSIAFKLSNGPIAIVVPMLWLWTGDGFANKIRRLVVGCTFTVLGFLLAYGYWGWQLWIHVGNPIYPFFDGWFEPLRRLSQWAR